MTVVYHVEQAYLQKKKLSVENISASYANLIRNNVFQAVSAVYPLAALIRTQNGKVDGFSELATEMLPFYPSVASLQLAPNGIVQHIVPMKGNEKALGHNLLTDHKRSKAALIAKNTEKLTLAGPFHLVQGGVSIVAWLPIFLDQPNHEAHFWGFSTSLIRFSEVIKSAKLDSLAASGFAYELLNIQATRYEIEVIAHSENALLDNPVRFDIDVPNGKWQFKVTPVKNWVNPLALLLEILLALCFSFLVTFSVCLIKHLRENKQTLEELVSSRTQALDDNLKRLDLALAVAHQGWFDFNLLTQQVRVHDMYPALLGYKKAEFYKVFKGLEQWLDYIHPDDKGNLLNIYHNCMEKGVKEEVDYRIKTKDNNWKWIRSTGEIIEWDQNNKPVRMVGIHTDITLPKRNEQVLRALAETSSFSSEKVFKTIVRELALSHNINYASIACINPDNKKVVDTLVIWARDTYIDNVSYSLEGTPCEKILKNKNICYYPENIQNLFPKDHLLMEMNIHSYVGVPLKNSQNEVLGILAIFDEKPMTTLPRTMSLLDSLAVRASLELERRAMVEQLKFSSRVFNEAHESIVITDHNGIIFDVNPSFTTVTGYKREEVIGRHTRLFNPIKEESDDYHKMVKAFHEKGYWQGELWNRKKDGEHYAELLTISSLKNEEGETTHYVGLSTDITQIKQQQQKLEKMAHYDVLTKLPNRMLFFDRFSQAIAHSSRNKSLLAVCFIDLDGFKKINDTYGHNIGDQLLIKVTERISSIIREEDTLSRQGGDEFTLLIADVQSFEDCEKNLKRIIRSVAEPYLLEKRSLKVTASIGVTLYPLDDADQDTLIRHADQAMYQAKLSGRNRYHLFNAEEDQQTIQRLNQIQEIRQALLNDEFCLYYQPKVNMETGEVFGVEALIRWQHPEKGIILPADFLNLIKETEVEAQLGYWVINEALKQLDQWRVQGLEFEMSINISSRHLEYSFFFTQLKQVLEKYTHINSKHVQLEILESSALGDLHEVSRIIKNCRNKLGVHIALDDFGTGYSSLTHLRNLPVNAIKIDKSFVRDLLDDPNDFSIIDGVIGLAGAFHRDVIAEGVETIEHGLVLLIMGCQQAQGYGIAKPMPGGEILIWVKNYVPHHEWVSLNKQTNTIETKEIMFLKLITKHWFKSFNEKIVDKKNDGDWPVINYSKCHFGLWIKRVKQDRLFDPQWLSKLDHELRDMYQLAQQLKAKEIKGKTFEINMLKNRYETLIETLNEYKK